MPFTKSLALTTALLAALQGCDCGQPVSRGGLQMDTSVADTFRPQPDFGVRDIATEPGTICGAVTCQPDEICYEGQCIPFNGRCTTADECGNDSRCENGTCIPFGTPAGTDSDPSCRTAVTIDGIRPSEQCRWATGAGTPFAGTQVMSTPVVVDFNFDDNARTLQPSILFASYEGSYATPGWIRVIDGQTCAVQHTINAAAKSPASLAVADLTGDGRAEIIAATVGGGVAAYTYNTGSRTFQLMWTAATCSGGTRTPDIVLGAASLEQWAGPEVHDLNDDGVPEILYGRGFIHTYDAMGCRLDAINQGFYSRGIIPVVSDVDGDGRPELVTGAGVYAWSATGHWEQESYFMQTGANAQGHSAVADMGNFPLAAFGGQDRAEVVVVSGGMARVQTLDGRVVFGPFMIPGGGEGGPPTIADFDGDGRREFASAGRENYAVFDLDCVAGGDPARCGGRARTDGLLWIKSSQDASSNVTGSSVFDFDANGAAEVVYADECFLRVYDGTTGAVLFSAPRSSGTTYDNPVIADVDGDFHTEIVVSATNMACSGNDPHMPNVAPINTSGVIVYRDPMDRWATSRPIWNQHGYSITNVGDFGSIPRSSLVARNWSNPMLNNYRQNVQGTFDSLGTPDLTTRPVGDRLRVDCNGTPPRATLVGRVCNRGQLPMAAGFVIEFREARRDGTALCRASSTTFLGVGQCDEARCEANLPSDHAIDVYVVADPDGTSAECHEGNNFGFQPNVGCTGLP